MTTVHASAVLVGARAILIQGPAGSGKSRLALALIEAANTGQLVFARLVADDRVLLEAVHGRLLVRPPDVLAGLIEVRGLRIRRIPHEPVAVVGWVVDLDADDAQRLPPLALRATLASVTLPRFAIPSCADPLPVVLAALRTTAAEADLD